MVNNSLVIDYFSLYEHITLAKDNNSNSSNDIINRYPVESTSIMPYGTCRGCGSETGVCSKCGYCGRNTDCQCFCWGFPLVSPDYVHAVAVANVDNVGSSDPCNLERNGYHQCASWMVCQS